MAADRKKPPPGAFGPPPSKPPVKPPLKPKTEAAVPPPLGVPPVSPTAKPAVPIKPPVSPVAKPAVPVKPPATVAQPAAPGKPPIVPVVKTLAPKPPVAPAPRPAPSPPPVSQPVQPIPAAQPPLSQPAKPIVQSRPTLDPRAKPTPPPQLSAPQATPQPTVNLQVITSAEVQIAPPMVQPLRRAEPAFHAPQESPDEEPPNNFAGWIRSRPKWFWVAVVIVGCMIGGAWQVYLNPMWRGREYEERQQFKRAQQQAQTEVQKDSKDDRATDADKNPAAEPAGN